MDSMLTIAEIAEMYGVSTKTVRRWGAQGQIKLLRLPGGRLLRVDAASLQGILEPVHFKGACEPRRHKKRDLKEEKPSQGNFHFMSWNSMVNS